MTQEEECQLFYAAIGEAITEWAHIDDALYMVLHRCLQPADHMLVAAAFYAVDAFRTRLAMADAVVRYRLAGSQHVADWEKLRRRINRKSRKRNELAHYQVLIDPQAPEGKRYKLVPALLDPTTPRIGLEPIGLHLNELRYRSKVFKALFRMLTTFVSAALPLVPPE